MNRVYFIIVVVFQIHLGFAQNITIRKVEVVADKVNLYYDLTDTDVSRSYTVSVFSSKDNYISPLAKLSGDLGLEIKPGGNKKITWSAREEFGNDFDGNVSLEIRGRIYIPFVRLDGLQKTFKRGVSNELTWTGGTQQNILNFDLYKGDEKVTSFANIANVGQYTMTIPVSVKPGSGYHFKITDSKNKDQIVHSKEFSVRRKIPLLFKIVPVFVVGGVIMALTPSNGSDNSIKSAVLPDDKL